MIISFFENSKVRLGVKIVISLLFGLSLYYKLNSYSDFIGFLGSIFNLSDSLNLFFGNIIIASELFILIALIIEKDDEDVIDFTILLLLIFIAFSGYLIYTNNVKNCFCFGAYLEFTPAESILKNIVLVSILFKLKKTKRIRLLELKKIFVLLSIIIVIQLTITEPVDYFVENIPEIEFANIKNSNDYVLIDARNEDLYNKNHIPNAINIPYNSLKQNKAFDEKTLEFLYKNDKYIFIVYCDNTMCGLAGRLARYIREKNKKFNVAILHGGIDAWLATK